MSMKLDYIVVDSHWRKVYGGRWRCMNLMLIMITTSSTCPCVIGNYLMDHISISDYREVCSSSTLVTIALVILMQILGPAHVALMKVNADCTLLERMLLIRCPIILKVLLTRVEHSSIGRTQIIVEHIVVGCAVRILRCLSSAAEMVKLGKKP